MMFTGNQHNSSLSLWTILLSIMAILFNEPLYTSLTSIGWIETVYKELKRSLNSDILVLVALVSSLLICDNAVQRLRGNAAVKSIAVLVPVLVTVICFRVFHSAEYTQFYLLPEIKYADATITIDKDRDDNEFLLLNSRYTHALFGKKDNCIPFLD